MKLKLVASNKTLNSTKKTGRRPSPVRTPSERLARAILAAALKGLAHE